MKRRFPGKRRVSEPGSATATREIMLGTHNAVQRWEIVVCTLLRRVHNLSFLLPCRPLTMNERNRCQHSYLADLFVDHFRVFVFVSERQLVDRNGAAVVCYRRVAVKLNERMLKRSMMADVWKQRERREKS